MSKAHLPPVPPDNKGPAGNATKGKGPLPEAAAKENMESRDRDPEQQGRQGNTWQNTHNKGYQQDR